MDNITQSVFKQALDLEPVARAELIEGLFHSLDPNREDWIDALWSEEAESRIAGYDAGKIMTHSLAAVLTRLQCPPICEDDRLD